MVMTRTQTKAIKEAIAWTGPLTRSKAAAREQWTANSTTWNTTITIEDVAAAAVLMDLKDASWDNASTTNSIASRRPRRSCRRD
jgi:hypothetical protein